MIRSARFMSSLTYLELCQVLYGCPCLKWNFVLLSLYAEVIFLVTHLCDTVIRKYVRCVLTFAFKCLPNIRNRAIHLYFFYWHWGLYFFKQFWKVLNPLKGPTLSPASHSFPPLDSRRVLFKETLMASLFMQYKLFSVMIIRVQRLFYDDS